MATDFAPEFEKRLHAQVIPARIAWTPLIEPTMKLCSNDQMIPWTNKQTALCMWDDLIEIRQAALYEIDQQTGPAYLELFQSVIPSIVQVINHPEARSDDFIMATENGISSVARILKHCPQLPNHADLLKCWLDWLPIWEDEDEVPTVMGYLLELIEQNNLTVMGANSANLPRLVAIVAEVFARSVIDTKSEVGTKMVNFLKQVHANLALSGCLGSLTIHQQKAVQEAIAG